MMDGGVMIPSIITLEMTNVFKTSLLLDLAVNKSYSTEFVTN
jgi:hypothetical protein